MKKNDMCIFVEKVIKNLKIKLIGLSVLFVEIYTHKKKRNNSVIKNKCRFQYKPDALLLQLLHWEKNICDHNCMVKYR